MISNKHQKHDTKAWVTFLIESNSDKYMHQKEEFVISYLLKVYIDDIIFGSTNEELYEDFT